MGNTATNEVLPLMMARYFGPGLLGLGVTALLAGFMSGMAGNVSAFRHRLELRHLQAADPLRTPATLIT